VTDLQNKQTRILIPALFGNVPAEYAPPILQRFTFYPDSKSLIIGYGGKLHRLDVNDGKDQIIPFIANVKVDMGAYNYHTFPVSHDSLVVKYTRSASISPDHKHVIFMALGKLYVKDLPSGKPHLLYDQGINQFQPQYSPDGKSVAYITWCDSTGGALWRIGTSGGKPEKLSASPGRYERPAWSPDSKSIAVVNNTSLDLGFRDNQETGKLILVSIASGTTKVIDDNVSFDNLLRFSKDGKRIIYKPEQRQSIQGQYNPMLVSRDLETMEERVLAMGALSDRQAFIRQCSLSPDGRFLVYSRNEDLYLVPLTGHALPNVILNSNQEGLAIRFASGVDPEWEKNGKILSWSYGNQFFSISPDKIVHAASIQKNKQPISWLPGRDIVDCNVMPSRKIALNVKVPEFYAHGTLGLINARIITMQGNNIIKHGSILIKNGRIAAVGPVGTINIPGNAKDYRKIHCRL